VTDLERWRQIDALLLAALERDPGERQAFLEEACAGDEALKVEVRSLLSAGERPLGLIDTPAIEVAAGLLSEHVPELAEGQIVGHYRVLSFLGAGGMGEVYLAKDEKLNRRVALKLLQSVYTRNQDRLRRLEQEARAASALNHPNILTIHEIGHVGDHQFIATEFVEGENLRQRLARGALSLSEALEIAAQVGSALTAAHEAGIVHRDIKPENIMLRPDGYVKVLDFGLAKLHEQQERAAQARVDDDVNVSSGLVMGTVRYMSPEQARGLPVDPRSDIFSLGVVLYEMLAGRTPFEGEDPHELIAAILRKEPAQLTDVPEAVRRLVGRALSKSREDRYQTIRDLLADLKAVKERHANAAPGAQVATQDVTGSARQTGIMAAQSTVSTVEYVVSGIKRRKAGTALILASLAVVAFGAMFGLSRFMNRQRAASGGTKITRIPYTDKAVGVAVSPDGKYIAYAEINSWLRPRGEQSLWVLEVATNNRVQIAAPAAVNYGGLTYSPNGADIFYVNGNALYRVPARGGEVAKVLSDVRAAISFAPGGAQLAFIRALGPEETALVVANADGGGERVLAARKRPEFLAGPAWSPDGAIIACASAGGGQMGITGFDATTGEERRITDQKWLEVLGRVVWLPDGSGLVASAMEKTDDQIWLIPYPSGEARRVTGEPSYNYTDLGLTADGKHLVALKGARRSKVWLVPSGAPEAATPITSDEHNLYRHVAWTPDGRILYASNVGTSRDIWIMNGDGTNPKELTANAGVNLQPRASADGRFIVFSSNRAPGGAFNIWRMNMDGSDPVQLTRGSGEGQPVCSPDGRWVVYAQGGPNTTPEQKTLWKAPIDGGEPVRLSDRPASGPAVSPDSTEVACWYKPDPASPSKLALIPLAGGPPVKIFDVTRTGITPPRWTPDGREISYINTREGFSNIWSQPASGGPPKQITRFTSEQIEGFDWSREGTLVCSRLHGVQDAVLISDFR
jgi:eukaryotic-like serine/threonine-protein kinase